MNSEQRPPIQRVLVARVLVVLLAGFLPYLSVLQAGFIWDDESLWRNPLMRGSLLGVWTDPGANPTEHHYWPALYTVFWVLHRFFHLHPAGYHAVNVLLHCANSLLVWRVMHRCGFRGGFLAALLFAVHPVHVEPVAWIISLKDVLSTFVCLCVALAWFRFLEEGRLKWYGIVAMLFAWAVLTKHVAVTLPVSLGVACWAAAIPVRRRDRLLLAALLLIGVAGVLTDWLVVGLLQGPRFQMTIVERVLLASRSVFFYASKLMWPYPLMTLYPKWTVNAAAISQYIWPIALALLTVFLWGLRSRIGRGPLAAWLIYVVTLSPMLGFVRFNFLNHSFVADRFQYMASIAPIVLLSSIAVTRIPPRIGLPFAAGILSLLASLTFVQATLYRNDLTLFSYNLRHNPGSATVNLVLAKYYAARADVGPALAHFSESFWISAGARQAPSPERLEWYETMATENPTDHNIRYDVGLAMARAGKLDVALDHFTSATQLAPRMEDGWVGKAAVLAKTGRTQEALQAISRTVPLEAGWIPPFAK